MGRLGRIGDDVTLGPIYPAGTSPKDRITGERLTHLDTQMQRAVDGYNGGTYAVNNPIKLGGRVVMLGAGGIVSQRVSIVTSTTTPESITVYSDYYISAVTSSTSRQWTLMDTDALPGCRVNIVRDAASDSGNITILRESDGVTMMTMTGTAFAQFEHDGTDWRTLRWGGTISGGRPNTI